MQLFSRSFYKFYLRDFFENFPGTLEYFLSFIFDIIFLKFSWSNFSIFLSNLLIFSAIFFSQFFFMSFSSTTNRDFVWIISIVMSTRMNNNNFFWLGIFIRFSRTH